LATLLERLKSLGESLPADPLARGVKHHERKEYLKALEAWKKAGPKGNAEAAYRIGLLYALGEGVLQSIPDAVIWYKRAAEQGQLDAQFQLGLIYLNGSGARGPNVGWMARASERDASSAQRAAQLFFPHGLEVQKDIEEARRWIEAAANGGKPEAQAVLGSLHERGVGCERDYEAARRWYLAAAEQDNAAAQFGLGDIYFQGLGLDAADPAAAADWYEKAAKKGDVRAQVAMGTIYLKGQGRLTDIDRAKQYFGEAAEKGEARSLYQLAMLLLGGEGPAADTDRAETYLRKSAKQNYLPAINALAEFYSRGKGVAPDLREAADWYARAAELGDVQSQFMIGRLYATGTGVPSSVKTAAKWFLKAAEQGHATAAHNIAVFYLRGNGIERDPEKAVKFFEVAAASGIAAAQTQLGKLHVHGEGVPRDLKRALDLLRNAAEAGDADGKTTLAMLHLQGVEGGGPPGRAEQLLKDAATSGYPFAAMQLAHLYASGKFVADGGAIEALGWYRMAAEGGLPDAQHVLGLSYLEGRGVPKEPETAASWLSKAAESNHAASEFQLAVMHCTGNGVSKDLGRAVAWYEAAASHGHRVAQYNLAVMLVKGQGCKADQEKALEWFQKAADQGMVEAQNALVRYRSGSAAPQDGSVPAPRIDHSKPEEIGTRDEPGRSLASQIPDKVSAAASWMQRKELPRPGDSGPPTQVTIARLTFEKAEVSPASGPQSSQSEARDIGAQRRPSESVDPQASPALARYAPELPGDQSVAGSLQEESQLSKGLAAQAVSAKVAEPQRADPSRNLAASSHPPLNAAQPVSENAGASEPPIDQPKRDGKEARSQSSSNIDPEASAKAPARPASEVRVEQPVAGGAGKRSEPSRNLFPQPSEKAAKPQRVGLLDADGALRQPTTADVAPPDASGPRIEQPKADGNEAQSHSSKSSDRPTADGLGEPPSGDLAAQSMVQPADFSTPDVSRVLIRTASQITRSHFAKAEAVLALGQQVDQPKQDTTARTRQNESAVPQASASALTRHGPALHIDHPNFAKTEAPSASGPQRGRSQQDDA
jgi:TPR repeat protein